MKTNPNPQEGSPQEELKQQVEALLGENTLLKDLTNLREVEYYRYQKLQYLGQISESLNKIASKQ